MAFAAHAVGGLSVDLESESGSRAVALEKFADPDRTERLVLEAPEHLLAGAELDPEIVRRRWREALGLGLASSLLPTLMCVAAARYLLDWSWSASVLAGVALSATSVAVVYTVMLETGLNRTTYGKVLLAADDPVGLGQRVIDLGLSVRQAESLLAKSRTRFLLGPPCARRRRSPR
ncbi:MAG: hypothetical protein HC869_27170 [Rhodospirillales bacterium]|nr:hypothetical protein [Rhodospirillales bacterium]